MKSFFKYLFLLVFLSQFSFSQNRIDSDLIDSKIIRLNNHEIEFYWNLEPLNAENAFDISVLKNPQILKLPRANWGQLENTERKGFGTFVYRVSLPDTIHSYALFTPRFSGGVKIWVNDQLQGSHGVYNRDVKESSSYAKPLQINLPKEKKIVVTILTANNEQFLGGGIDYFLAVGKQNLITKYINKELVKDYIVFLLLIFLTLYLAYLFYVHKEKRYLYLMLACLTGVLRSICIQQHIIYEIIPVKVPFYVIQKLRLMTVYMGCIAMLLYFRELLPNQVHKIWFRFLLYIQSVGLALYFFVSTFMATRIAVMMRIIFLVVMIYYLYLVIRAFFKKEHYAKEIALTTLFIVIVVINGVFKTAIVVNTNFIGVAALFLFLLAHMLINAKMQRDKIDMVLQLSNELGYRKEEIQNLKLETLRRIREKQKIKASLKDLPNRTTGVQSILADMQKNNGEDEKSRLLKSQIVADHQKFTSKLTQLHPTLSKTDIEVATFIVLGKTRQEIADLRAVSIASVKTSRNRLRKKLDLPKEVLLDEYLKSIL